MENQAWYRQFRPKVFADVVGQDDTIQILKNSLINQKFHHAYLFSGTKGTGKTSVAKILARVVNCENIKDGEACQTCSNCQKISKHQDSVDIIEIDGASNNGVEEIRAIKKNVNILPMDLKYKVYIIDEVHMLTTAAFNALLKTLEEPPKHVIFIFATTEAHKVPATIISRCHWFTFSKIELSLLKKSFCQILDNKMITYEPAAIDEIALLADGSLRDGINHLEKVVNFSQSVNVVNVVNLFGIISVTEKINFLLAFFNHDFIMLDKIIRRINLYLSDFKQFVLQVFQINLDLVLYKTTNSVQISKILNSEQLELFEPVNIVDAKIVLAELTKVLNSDINNNELIIALLMSIIIHLSDKFQRYELSINSKKVNAVKDNNGLSSEITSNKELKTKSHQLSTADNKVSLKSKLPEKLKTKELIKSEILENTEMLDLAFQKAVMNVIIQADSKIRKNAKIAWTKIEQLIATNKFRNLSKFYLGTTISAAATNAIIIICDNIIQAELINKKFVFKEHRDFLKFVLNENFMVYALDKKQWKMIGEQYKKQVTANTLPVPEPIIIPEATMVETNESKSETLLFLKKFFSEIEEI